MGVLQGAIWYNLGNDQSSIRDRFGLFFISCAMYPFMVILNTISQYDAERMSLYTELQDGMYQLLPYYMAKILSELPFHFVFAVMYGLPIWGLAGLKSSLSSLVMFSVVVFLSIYSSRAIALAIGAALTDFQAASFVCNLIFTMFLFPAGFVVNIESMYPAVSWIGDISFVRHAFASLSMVEFEDLHFVCPEYNSPVCPINTGQEALESFSMGGMVLSHSLAILVAIIVLFRALAYAFMRSVDQKPSRITT